MLLADAGDCGLEIPGETAGFTSFASSHTLQPPKGPGIIAVWSSRWMDGPARVGRGTRTPDTRPADAVYPYTELAKCLSLSKQPPASALLPLPVWMAWICPLLQHSLIVYFIAAQRVRKFT